MGSNWNVDNTGNLTTGSIGGKTVANVASATTEALAATATPTASTTTQWDANKNLSANNSISGYTTTATAAGTTTLNVGSAEIQYFTGSTTQSVLLPVTSTLVLGQQFLIQNRSTGVVTVKSSGSNTIKAMETNTQLLVTCILVTGTTAASWDFSYAISQGILPVDDGGTGQSSVISAPAASGWAGWDANKNLSANNFLDAYTTTATAAATTTLTVGSTSLQYFTGSTTQNVKMPVASTLVLGQRYIIENRSTGVVTVESSGSNSIQVMAANTQAILTCILTSGTTAASWDTVYSTITASSGGSQVGNLVFVSSLSGSDTTGNGAISNPYATIVHAISTISTATSSNPFNIIIMGGYQNETGTISLIPWVNLVGFTSGTFINNTNAIGVSSTAWTVNTYNEVYFEGLTFNGAVNLDFSSIASGGPTFYTNIITITNCTFNSTFVGNGNFYSTVGLYLYLSYFGSTTLDNCTITSNTNLYTSGITIGSKTQTVNFNLYSWADNISNSFSAISSLSFSANLNISAANFDNAGTYTSITLTNSTCVLYIDSSLGQIIPTLNSGATYNNKITPGASISWTPGYTGFSVNPTASAAYQKIGKLCHIYFTTTGTGTSNATTFTITGLPFTVATATTFFIQATNAGSTAVGYATVSGTTITLSDALLGSSGWTATGAKGASFQFFYETTV